MFSFFFYFGSFFIFVLLTRVWNNKSLHWLPVLHVHIGLNEQAQLSHRWNHKLKFKLGHRSKNILCNVPPSKCFWFFLFGFALKCFTHCICCPHRCCRRSRWLRHTPSAWGCSGGCCTQTEWRSKIHLEMDGKKNRGKNKTQVSVVFFCHFFF